VLAKVAAARRMLSRQRALDQAVREWQGIASRDELTGVCSRRFFFEEAARTLAEGHTVGIILLDLDNFKKINDTHGHLTGDRILRDIGSQFLRRTRHGDVIARFGGDEFVLLVSGLTLEEMRNVGRRVAADLEMLQWSSGSETLRVSATFGVSSSTLIANATVDQVLEAADRDLYLNKWLRRNPDATPEDLYRYERERSAEVVGLRTRSQERDKRQRKS
jgi:diguanylate cyclase (GGDEF)-like protein